MQKTIIAILVLLALCSGCNVEVAPDGAGGTQDTSTIFVDNGCGC